MNGEGLQGPLLVLVKETEFTFLEVLKEWSWKNTGFFSPLNSARKLATFNQLNKHFEMSQQIQMPMPPLSCRFHFFPLKGAHVKIITFTALEVIAKCGIWARLWRIVWTPCYTQSTAKTKSLLIHWFSLFHNCAVSQSQVGAERLGLWDGTVSKVIVM